MARLTSTHDSILIRAKNQTGSHVTCPLPRISMTDLPSLLCRARSREVTKEVTCVTHECPMARSMELIVWSVNSGKYSVNPRLTL